MRTNCTCDSKDCPYCYPQGWMEREFKTEDAVVNQLAKAMADSMSDLIQACIEQRLRQILPLIKEGLKNDQ